ncbi:YdcF family protein [Candidatus Parcubacteria bacterium]|nr:YdcF family protein [Candidatus Parcubacteria bacterium]
MAEVAIEKTAISVRPKPEHFDLIVVLGSQVMKVDREYYLAAHTRLKADAAVIAWKMGMTGHFLASGGPNFGVRYNEKDILSKVDSSFEAFARAGFEKSEAEIIRDYMVKGGVPGYRILLEKSSAFTKEHPEFIKILLERDTFDFVKRIGILTMVYHQKGFSVFEEEFYGEAIEVVPVYTEKIIVDYGGPEGAGRVRGYYGREFPETYKKPAPFDIDKLIEILAQGRNIAELLEE